MIYKFWKMNKVSAGINACGTKIIVVRCMNLTKNEAAGINNFFRTYQSPSQRERKARMALKETAYYIGVGSANLFSRLIALKLRFTTAASAVDSSGKKPLFYKNHN